MNPCVPGARQELLLRAALGEGTEALKAWRDWRAGVDWATLDGGSQRLLPLLHRNLARLGADDPEMPRLKGTYRQTWYTNQILIAKVSPLLSALEAAAIPTALLKGAALTPYYFGDVGLRPMNDFDLLVPTDQSRAAIAVLIRCGWTPLYGVTAEQVTTTEIPRMHGWGFRDRDGRVVDLHWHVLHDSLLPGDDREFWQAARPARIAGLQSHALCPTDLLFHVCFHGARFDPMPQPRWIADAMRIMAAARTEIDWERLEDLAGRKRLRLPLADTLEYLADAFAAPVPQGLPGRLRRRGRNLADRVEYRATVSPFRLSGFSSAALLAYRRYVRWRLRQERTGLRALGAYAKETTGVPRLRWLPLHALFLLCGRPWALRARLPRNGTGPSSIPGPVSAPYVLGTPVSFASGGNASRHAGIGWSLPEETGTWTDGREARLSFTLEASPDRDLRMSVLLAAFVQDRRPRLDADVVVNGRRLVRWTFRAPEEFHARDLVIPGAIASRRRPLEVVFHVRDPRSPAAMGLRGDLRRLGLHLHSFVLQPMPEATGEKSGEAQAGGESSESTSSAIRSRRSSRVSRKRSYRVAGSSGP